MTVRLTWIALLGLVAVLSAGCEESAEEPISTRGHMTVSGRFLYDKCGEQIVIRGVEIERGMGDTTPVRIDEIAKSQANAIRFIIEGMDAAQLEANLELATDNGMIVSVVPGSGDYTDTSWWNQPDVKTVLMDYEPWVILHAYGEGAYESDSTHARWLSETKAVIEDIRSYGYEMPIEILSDQWGQDLTTTLGLGQEIIDADPEHNILLGNQLYGSWNPFVASPAFPDESTFASIVDSGLPFLLGTCISLDPGDPSKTAGGQPIDQYQFVWQQTYEHQIGSFYYDWGPGIDGMTTDGYYGNWTEVGQVIAGSGDYSLPRTANKTRWMLTGKCE